MRRRGLWAALLGILLLLSGRAQAQGTPDGQGMVAVGGLGGEPRGMVALQDGFLLAEGSALVRIDTAGRALARVTHDRGSVQDLAASNGSAYLLTETGLGVYDPDSLVERAFLPGGAQALAVTDQAVYAAAQQAGIRVAPFGREGLPRHWTDTTTSGPAIDVAVHPAGSYLYAALGENGLGVYALEARETLAPVRVIDALGAIQTVEVVDGLLFAGSEHRLYVFDLTNPADPALNDRYDPPHDARALILRGEWVYIADAAGGLKRYAIGNLRQPRYDGVIWPGEVYDLADDGSALYLAAGWEGVIALVSPRNAEFEARGRLALPGQATTVAVSEAEGIRRALIGLGAEGVALADWSDIDAPHPGAVLPLGGAVRAVALRESLGFAAVEGVGLVIIGAGNVNAPTLLATLPLEGVPQSLVVGGTRLYIAAGEAGLYIVETVRPTEAAVVGRVMPQRADQAFLHVGLEGKRAYISAGNELLIADVDPDELPRILSTTPNPAGATASAVRDLIAYVIGPNLLTIINGGSSSAPELLGSYASVDHIRAILAHGNRLWLAGSGGSTAAELQIEPGGLREVRAIAGYGEGRALAWQDGSAWLASTSGWYRLRDSGVELARGYWSGGDVLSAAAGDRLLVGGPERWSVLEVTAGEPRAVLETAAPGSVIGLTETGDTIFAALGEGGVLNYTRNDGGAQSVGQWSPQADEGAARDAAADGMFVFVAEDGPGDAGTLRVLDAESMGVVTAIPLPGRARAVELRDGLVYVPYMQGDGGGLAVLDVSAPTAGLRRAGEATLPASGLALAAEGHTGYAAGGNTLTVFDLGGWPQVRSLVSLTLPQPVEYLLLDDSGRWLAGLLPGRSVLLLDLSNPLYPHPVASLEIGAADAEIYGDTLFLAMGTDGLQAVNLSNLDSLTGQIAIVTPETTSALWRDGAMLYTSGGSSLRAYDMTDPRVPVRAAVVMLNGAQDALTLTGRSTRRDGRWLYIGTDAGLWAAYHAPDGAMAAFGPFDLPGVLAAGEHWLYFARASHQIDIAALTDPATPGGGEFTYPLPGFGSAATILAWEDRVLAGSPQGMIAFTRTAAGARLSSLLGEIGSLPGIPQSIQVAGTMAWVTAGSGGVWQIDVSDPTAPVLQTVIDVPGEAHGAALSPDGSHLAVAAGSCGVRLLDLTADPPHEIGYWRGEASDVAAVGDLYAALNEEGLTLLRETPDGAPILPAAPFNPSPADQAEGMGQHIELLWSPPPDPCDGIHYEVWAGAGNDAPQQIAVTEIAAATLSDLPPDQVVRWQVRAIDAQGDTATGPVWEFNTGTAILAGPQYVSAERDDLIPPLPTPLPVPETLLPDQGFRIDAGTGKVLLLCGVFVEAVIVVTWWQFRRMKRRHKQWK